MEKNKLTGTIFMMFGMLSSGSLVLGAKRIARHRMAIIAQRSTGQKAYTTNYAIEVFRLLQRNVNTVYPMLF